MMKKGKKVDLQVKLGPLTLKNPIMPASGTFSIEENSLLNYYLKELGALVCKSITLGKEKGNPPPRVYEVPAGMINAVGIPSAGIDSFLTNEFQEYKRAHDCNIVSISAHNTNDFLTMVQKLNHSEGVAAIELNLSCPNIGGIPFAKEAGLLEEVIKRVRKETTLPLIAKLTPNVSYIGEMAKVAEESGADIVSLINTVSAMVIDIETQKPLLGNAVGGLSGPAIKPVAVHKVWETYKAVSIPIIGMGGITTGEDAVEFMLAGATAVAIGTAGLCNPLSLLHIVEQLESYLEKHGYTNPMNLVGLAH